MTDLLSRLRAVKYDIADMRRGGVPPGVADDMRTIRDAVDRAMVTLASAPPHSCDAELRKDPRYHRNHCDWLPVFHCSCGRIWEHVCDEAEGCFYTEVTDERNQEDRAGADGDRGAGIAPGDDDLRGARDGADG